MHNGIRQTHRWLSIAFTLGVINNVVHIFVLGEQTPSPWVGMTALVPLLVLLCTGLYLFALPYVVRAKR